MLQMVERGRLGSARTVCFWGTGAANPPCGCPRPRPWGGVGKDERSWSGCAVLGALS